MTGIQINMELPEEFFSDILITAFDGVYGGSWAWFEPVDNNWLSVKNEVGHNCVDNPWMSARVRLQENCKTGVPLFDSREGFVIDHESLAGGISRIVNDDYLHVWRVPTATEASIILNEEKGGNPSTRVWRRDPENNELQINTGETAAAWRSDLTRFVQNPEEADIDADLADCIVQAAAFGKVIFG